MRVLSSLFINTRYTGGHLPWFTTSCNQPKVVCKCKLMHPEPQHGRLSDEGKLARNHGLGTHLTRDRPYVSILHASFTLW